jgi:DnaJ-class molecular chaperone
MGRTNKDSIVKDHDNLCPECDGFGVMMNERHETVPCECCGGKGIISKRIKRKLNKSYE